MKICLAASSGGHLTQLLRLKPSWEGHDCFFVTVGGTAVEFLREEGRAYDVGWANRKHPVLLMRMCWNCMRIAASEKPDVTISTGAAVGCIMGFLTKLRGGRLIWIDTISHSEFLTLSGRISKFFADEFLVQWPELVRKYKGTKYVGSVL